MARLLVYTAILFWAALAAAQHNYNDLLIGCFEGRSDDFSMAGLARTQGGREECAVICSQRGGSFVAFGTPACFCTESEPPSTRQVDNSRCEAVGWNAPKLRKLESGDEELFIVFSIDPKRKSDHSDSASQDEATSLSQSGKPAALSSPGFGKPIGCFPGLPLDVNLTKITITENDRRECAKSCAEEGKPAVVFSGLKCGCTDVLPETSTRVEDIWCTLQSTGELYRTDLVYSVWSTGITGIESDMNGYESVSRDHLSEPEEIFTELLEPGQHPGLKKPVGQCVSSRTRISSQALIFGNPEDFRGACLDHCKGIGESVALIHGPGCWCASAYPHKSYYSGLDSCNLPCQGDEANNCGGIDDGRIYYSVYSTGVTESVKHDPLHRPFDRAVLDETTWRGCWSHVPLTKSYPHTIQTNTVLACSSHCWRQKAAVAALRQDACVCADSYPARSHRLPDSSCRLPCPGYPYDNCGGTEAWTVLNTGLETFVPHDRPGRKKQTDDDDTPYTGWNGASLLGCYNMEPTTVGTPKRLDINRVQRCVSECRYQNKPVSVLQNDLCLCANTIPHKDSKVDGFHCNLPCRGAKKGYCGGKDTWSVYNTGLRTSIHTDSSKKLSHGCFRFQRLLSDRTPQLLRLDMDGPNQSRDGDSCTTKCAEEGFGVALRRNSECICSPGLPQESKRVSNRSCPHKCRGNSFEMCGGPDYAYTVYKTDIYKPDIQKNEEPKHRKPNHGNPSMSLDGRPQCLHPALEKAHEILSLVSDKVAALTERIQDGFYCVRDKAQNVFDVCLWNVMVFFSNILYHLGLLSSNDDIEL